MIALADAGRVTKALEESCPPTTTTFYLLRIWQGVDELADQVETCLLMFPRF